MGLRRISEPAIEPVSIFDVKQHAIIEYSTSDELIDLYISAARGAIENWCHIVIAESDWELTYDGFPGSLIEIPKAPLASVVSVTYDDESDAALVLSSSAYTVDLSQSFGRLVVGTSGWPMTNGRTNSVRIAFKAGWPNDGDLSTAPPPLKQAIMLLVAQWFENREPTAAGAVSEIPFAVEALISPYRVPVLV